MLYLASTVWLSTQNFDTGVTRMTAFGEQSIHHGDNNFLRTVSNFVWHVYVLLVWRLRGNAYKFPSPWHKSSHRLLFWEVLRLPRNCWSVLQCSRLSPLLSLGFAWCRVFLMVYVTTSFLAAESWVWLITPPLTKRMNDLPIVMCQDEPV